MRTLINVIAALGCGLASLVSANSRDPFIPEPDPCDTPLVQARYRGFVAADGRFIALIAGPGKSWLRWSAGTRPEPGWQVVKIDADSVILRGPAGCPRLALWRAQPGGKPRDEIKYRQERPVDVSPLFHGTGR